MLQSATPATQNDMTTCLETFEKERLCNFPHRHGEATGKPETRDETRGRRNAIISCETSSNLSFRRVIKLVGMSQSATAATQNGMTTCLETFEKESFCSFPNRHGEATGKPESPSETRGHTKTSISCETSANFHSWKHAKRRCFAASPIDTAKPQENLRLQARRVGAPKQAFRARLPPILTLSSIKIDALLRVFSGT